MMCERPYLLNVLVQRGELYLGKGVNQEEGYEEKAQ